ncbi:MAG: ORF6N domain-containing protein [Desulfobacterales bacterium]|nr:ORF6N domain-containing protein [Desulfobacterales bacterium]
MKSRPRPGIPVERITEKIYLIRGHRDAGSGSRSLYQVETKALKQAVKRNIERFPDDFMLTLSRDEFDGLRSQIVTLVGRNPVCAHGLHRAGGGHAIQRASGPACHPGEHPDYARLHPAATDAGRLQGAEDQNRGDGGKTHAQSFQVVFDAIKKLLEVEARPKKKDRFYG